MTISFDTSASGSEDRVRGNPGAEFDDCSCGEPLDWLRSLGGLPSPQDPETLSGGLLARVIEREIIPRLLLAHLGQPHVPKPVDDSSVMALFDGDAFTDLVLRSKFAEIMDQVQAILDRGVSLQRVYLDLLAPVARRLGEYWEQDRCSFTDVTLGLSRLQHVLREVGRRTGAGRAQGQPKSRIYLVPAPGEQHTFGLSMVEEYFLHAGWETALDQGHSLPTIIETVVSQNIDLLGFTVGCEDFFDPLLESVAKVRKAARNRNVAIMIGGKFISDHPEITTKIEGVTFVSDGAKAVDTATRLISNTVRSSPGNSIR